MPPSSPIASPSLPIASPSGPLASPTPGPSTSLASAPPGVAPGSTPTPHGHTAACHATDLAADGCPDRGAHVRTRPRRRRPRRRAHRPARPTSAATDRSAAAADRRRPLGPTSAPTARPTPTPDAAGRHPNLPFGPQSQEADAKDPAALPDEGRPAARSQQDRRPAQACGKDKEKPKDKDKDKDGSKRRHRPDPAAARHGHGMGRPARRGCARAVARDRLALPTARTPRRAPPEGHGCRPSLQIHVRPSSSSTRAGSRGPGTTSRPTCRCRRRPTSIRRPSSRSARTTSRPLFPMALIGQEVSQEREIEIPEPVRDAYRLYRPSPLYRAHRLERALDTPAHIYYKYEGVSPAGSHKPNTAHRAGLLQQGAGRHPDRHRDRGGPVGQRDGVRRRAVRARGQGLHGPRQLRPEAVPADPDGDLRRGGRGQPVTDHELRPVASWRSTRTARARSGWPSARRSRTRRPGTTRSTRWGRCSTTCCSTRR